MHHDDVEALLQQQRQKIAKLTSRVKFLERHHKECLKFPIPSSPPTTSSDEVESVEENGNHSTQPRTERSLNSNTGTNHTVVHRNTRRNKPSITISHYATSSQSGDQNLTSRNVPIPTLCNFQETQVLQPGPALEIIQYRQASPKSVPRLQKWQELVNQFLHHIPSHDDWEIQRKKKGLHTEDTYNFCIKAIVGNFYYVASPSTSQPNPHILQRLQEYAHMTKKTKDMSGLLIQIHSFQRIVFGSLCYVLEFYSYPIEKINDAMKVCISESSDINLKHMRLGALWVNEVIVGLGEEDQATETGWGENRAAEMFLLYGETLSKYSVLRRNKDSKSNILRLLRQDPFAPPQDSAAAGCIDTIDTQSLRKLFSIPAFIKLAVKESLTLKQICDALGYKYSDKALQTLQTLCLYYEELRCPGKPAQEPPSTLQKDFGTEEIAGKRKHKSTEQFSRKRTSPAGSGQYEHVAEGVSSERMCDFSNQAPDNEAANAVDGAPCRTNRLQHLAAVVTGGTGVPGYAEIFAGSQMITTPSRSNAPCDTLQEPTNAGNVETETEALDIQSFHRSQGEMELDDLINFMQTTSDGTLQQNPWNEWAGPVQSSLDTSSYDEAWMSSLHILYPNSNTWASSVSIPVPTNFPQSYLTPSTFSSDQNSARFIQQ